MQASEAARNGKTLTRGRCVANGAFLRGLNMLDWLAHCQCTVVAVRACANNFSVIDGNHGRPSAVGMAGATALGGREMIAGLAGCRAVVVAGSALVTDRLVGEFGRNPGSARSVALIARSLRWNVVAGLTDGQCAIVARRARSVGGAVIHAC